MTDISKEAIERVVFDCRDAMRRSQDASTLIDAVKSLNAQAARIAGLEEKLSYVENRNVLLTDEIELYKQGATGAYLAGHDAGKAEHCVTVKPLRFSARMDQLPDGAHIAADCPFGRYYIASRGEYGFGWKRAGASSVFRGFEPTEDRAIDAAQADYERRILAGLKGQDDE